MNTHKTSITLKNHEGGFILTPGESLLTPWGSLYSAQAPENFDERDDAGNEHFYLPDDDNPYPRSCITYVPDSNLEGGFCGRLCFRHYVPEEDYFQVIKSTVVKL